jgi:hypothetical protein
VSLAEPRREVAHVHRPEAVPVSHDHRSRPLALPPRSCSAGDALPGPGLPAGGLRYRAHPRLSRVGSGAVLKERQRQRAAMQPAASQPVSCWRRGCPQVHRIKPAPVGHFGFTVAPPSLPGRGPRGLGCTSPRNSDGDSGAMRCSPHPRSGTPRTHAPAAAQAPGRASIQCSAARARAGPSSTYRCQAQAPGRRARTLLCGLRPTYNLIERADGSGHPLSVAAWRARRAGRRRERRSTRTRIP